VVLDEQPTPNSSLADWWSLLSPPPDYREEAGIYREHLQAGSDGDRVLTLLELGSGGGNNASFLKQWFAMTLADVSPQMLAHSRALDPECEHILGDMRTLRLGRNFDRVFITMPSAT
jgi:trans-aconitate methyltransferase